MMTIFEERFANDIVKLRSDRQAIGCRELDLPAATVNSRAVKS